MTESKFSKKRIREALASRFIHYGAWLPDSLYLRILFRIEMGKKLHLCHPRTFSEKLQWLKLYNRKPEYTKLVDKYAVKDYVAKVIGEEYIIPTLGVWDTPEQIDWDSLPNQFVLKTTHGGGNSGVVICRNKYKFDKQGAIDKLKRSFESNIYKAYREWPYRDVPPRVIAEKFLEPSPDLDDLPDYKFFCFDGEVKGLFVATGRQKIGEDVKFDFFDANFRSLPFKQGHENATSTPQKPKNFEKMKEIASQLSKGIPQVRIDLYELGEDVYFGEMTFFHFSGLVPFEPEKWDKLFGDMITLPGENGGG